MPEVNCSVTINKPVSQVFRYAIEADKVQQWQPDVESVHQTEDKLRVGVMITQKRNTYVMGWRLDLNADVITYQPNKIIEYKGVLGRFPVSGRMEFQSSGGITTVIEHINIRMGFIFGLFAPFMRGTMTRRTQRALNTLKEQLETQSNVQSSIPTDFHKEL